MKNNLMHLIVLGGNGFIGSHFTKHAFDAGHRVTVVDLLPEPRHAHSRPVGFVKGNIRVLAANRSLLCAADALVHCAYSTVPATANANPVVDLEQNLLPLIVLMQAMSECALSRIVYLSSGGAVYGRPRQVPISEDHPLDPLSAYGVSKVAAEKYLGLWTVNHGLRPTIIRPSNPYGPDQGKIGQLGAVTTFVDRALCGEKAVVWGDGSIVCDFIHIDDCARLILAMCETDAPGVYNCGAGRGASIAELIEIVKRATGRSLVVERHHPRSFDPPEIVLDIDRARHTFGWEPRIALEDGVAMLVEHSRKH